MTLLLGPPASGKTTLLKALAGKLEKDLRVCHFLSGLIILGVLLMKKLIILLKLDILGLRSFQINVGKGEGHPLWS